MYQGSFAFSPEDTDLDVLPTLYQQQIFKTKYARWREDLGRREHWLEAIDRYLDYMTKQVLDYGASLEDWEPIKADLRKAIARQEIMPSMRAFMTAGEALDKDNIAAYNCSYLAINRPEAFDEALYILCCGVGVGFSVESHYVRRLPVVPSNLIGSNLIILVEDSRIGWASALRQLIKSLYAGEIPSWDMSHVRPAGAPLKTFGGRASGPQPLIDLFNYVVETFKAAQGRKLLPIEAHGIMCKIGDIVVSGGVRRSALISLSDPEDTLIRDAKSGEWWQEHPEYALANNSAAWEGRPNLDVFIDEWHALQASGSGERGIFNRAGIQARLAKNFRRDPNYVFGTNPCGEICLRDQQTCNLSEIVARFDDTVQTLERKARLASTLGTIQSTFTNFRYLNPEWKRNCEAERLLGVSITGIMDCPLLSDYNDPDLPELLHYLQACVIEENEKWAALLGINSSTATTCVKPSGTVSQLVDASSGIHPRYAKYYIRTNRGNKIDPLAQFLYMSGIPAEDDIMKPDHSFVFSFPVKTPEHAITRDQVTALDQLRLWQVYADHWCEHQPSITVQVRDHEWPEVGAYVYNHFDSISGVSFLPYDTGIYQQAPYQEIDAEAYEIAIQEMPNKLDWDLLTAYESEDHTQGLQELACTAGACEI